MIAYLIVTGVVVSLFAYPAWRAATRADADDFAQLSNIRTTEVSERFIRHYLQTSRRLRTVLVAAAFFLPTLVGEALGTTESEQSQRLPNSWQAVGSSRGPNRSWSPPSSPPTTPCGPRLCASSPRWARRWP